MKKGLKNDLQKLEGLERLTEEDIKKIINIIKENLTAQAGSNINLM